MTILVTGGAGFIGSNFILDWFSQENEPIITLDKLTYASNVSNLSALHKHPDHLFVEGDIGNHALVLSLLQQHSVRAVVHFAAESHVDRSIHDPEAFIQTNIVGTFRLLETVRSYWNDLSSEAQTHFRFIHISTDEVFGSLEKNAIAFTESHRYAPNSPYSASKAASDHLVRAFHHTYGLPVITTHCSNNYGPYQFPEKFIPHCILTALQNKPIPIYGDGQQIRDWLYVSDHCAALRRVLQQGRVGETYNIGGWNEKTNIEVVTLICALLDQLCPRGDGQSFAEQISFTQDRPGHDRRYAIDASKIEQELQWKPAETFETGLPKTVKWYLANNPHWVGMENAVEV
ncbi:MAG: dTDP-glucose 4,6-dehydratase [Legionellaceae bacterium]|nr:dTDP-glucose 4,6-dehydratase [Legionellaceae bacterium]